MEPNQIISIGALGAAAGSGVIHVWNRRFYAQTDQAALLQQRLNQANLLLEQRESNEGILKQLQNDNADLRQEVEAHKVALMSGKQQPGLMEDVLADVQKFKAQAAQLESQLEAEKKEKNNAIQTIENLVKEKSQLRQQLDSAQTSQNAAPSEDHSAALMSLQAKLADSDSIIAELRNTSAHAMAEVGKLQSELSSQRETAQLNLGATNEIQSLTLKLQNAQSELQALKLSGNQTQSSQSHSDELNLLQNKIADLSRDLASAQHDLNFVIAERDELIAENEKLESSIGTRDELSQKLNTMEKDSQALAAAKAQANANDVKIRVLEQEIDMLRNRVGEFAKMEMEFFSLQEKADANKNLTAEIKATQEKLEAANALASDTQAKLKSESDARALLESNLASLQAQVVANEQGLKNQVEELTAKSESLLRSAAMVQPLQAKIQSLESDTNDQLAKSKERENELKNALEAMKSELEEAKLAAKNAEASEGLKARLQAVSEESAAYKSALATAYAQMSSLKTKLVTLAAVSPKDDLTQIAGITAGRQTTLNESGILTFRDLGLQSPERILDIFGAGNMVIEEAEQWISAARRAN